MNLLPKEEICFITERLVAVGMRSLEEYWSSTLWKSRRDYYWYLHGRICKRCRGRRRISLHHKTYKNLGREPDADLESLCVRCHRKHHRKETKMLKQRAITIVPAAVKFRGERFERGRWIRDHKLLTRARREKAVLIEEDDLI